MLRFVFLTIFLLLIAGCASNSRYTQQHDSAPSFTYSEPDLTDAEPKYEPYRNANLRPYQIQGITYSPLLTGKGYVEEGYASWYGQKFHGHLTSMGEVYDMFAMTAAHKTLPLPSYVKVTNLKNKKTAIVRVNDRGPFHSNRIIDLSYAASKKLDFQKAGTTQVKLEVIHFTQDNLVTVGDKQTVSYDVYTGATPLPVKPIDQTPTYFIQVAALADIKQADQLAKTLAEQYQVSSEIPQINNLYKLRLGPLKDRFKAKLLLDAIRQNGYPNAYQVEL